jgi:hypothetical protein
MERDMSAIPEALIRAREGRATLAEAESLATAPPEAARQADSVPEATPPAVALSTLTTFATDTAESAPDMSTTIPDDQLGLF